MCEAETGGAGADLLHNLDKIMLTLRIPGTYVRAGMPSPGRYSLPCGEPEGHKPARVCGRLAGHSLLTLFPLCAKRGAERPRVSDQSAVARREESRSGAAISGVRRGAAVPRRTEPKRVSAALAERTGFDRFLLDRARSGRRYRPESSELRLSAQLFLRVSEIHYICHCNLQITSIVDIHQIAFAIYSEHSKLGSFINQLRISQ